MARKSAPSKIEKTPIDPRSIKRVRSERFGTFYANNTEVGMSTWDVRIKFGQLRGGGDDELEVEEQVEILLSLPHAKAVALILAQYVKAYERENGPIKIPTGAQEATETDPGKSTPIVSE